MSRPRKFRPGPSVRSLLLLVHLIEQGGSWFYWPGSDRPKPASVLSNMSVSTLRGACLRGVRLAERVAL